MVFHIGNQAFSLWKQCQWRSVGYVEMTPQVLNLWRQRIRCWTSEDDILGVQSAETTPGVNLWRHVMCWVSGDDTRCWFCGDNMSFVDSVDMTH